MLTPILTDSAALRLMNKAAPSLAADRHDGRVRAVVLRAAAVPVAVVRRPDPAQAAGLPRAGRVPGGGDARHRGRRADRRRVGRQGAQARRRPAGATARWPRSSSTASSRRCTPTRGRCCARRRCSARPTSSSRPAARARTLPEGGRLANAQVGRHRAARRDLRRARPGRRAPRSSTWQQELAKGIKGRGRDFNDALGTLPGFAADGSDVLQVLDSQEGALQRLVKNTGVTFAALTENEQQLQTLITSSKRVFDATASRNDALAEAIRIFPTFLDESKATLARLDDVLARHRPAGAGPAAGGAGPQADARRRARAWRPTSSASSATSTR